MVRFYGDKSKADAVYAYVSSPVNYLFTTYLHIISGCEPLTPDDIAEVIVFTAGRRENVVVADTLIFPNHQVRTPFMGCFSDDTNNFKASATVLHKKS